MYEYYLDSYCASMVVYPKVAGAMIGFGQE
jgi:hypothetical protein